MSGPVPPAATGVCRRARREDLTQCAALYRHGFERGLRALFGRLPHRPLLDDALGIYLREDPAGFWVYDVNGRIDGYLLAALSLGRIGRRALFSPLMPRGLAHLVSGRYGIGHPHALFHAVREIVRFSRRAQDFRSHGDAQIVSIAVREASRGAGIGWQLMEAGLAYLAAAGAREVRLEVQPDNAAAQRLYASLGFVMRGEIPSPLGRALVMTCALPVSATRGRPAS